MSSRTHVDVPAPGRIRPFTPPRVETTRVGPGVPFTVARMPRIPLVTLNLLLDASESVVGVDDAGLAVFTGRALEGGTARRSASELAEALESIGTAVSVHTGWDATVIGMTCTADRTLEAFDLLAEMVLEPAFPADEVERLRNQRLAQIEHELADPRTLAGHSAARLVYAEGEPYGRRLSGERATVSRMDPERLAAFHARAYRPAGAAVVAAGDVDADALAARIEDRFAGWTGVGPGRPALSCAPRSEEPRVWIVHREGAVQSEIRIGHVGASRATPDFFALRVFNEILGGLFSSRLNLNLRERHGFTYGVRARFDLRRNDGPFLVSTAVETAVTAAAVREALSELRAMVGDGPTDEEVESARDYMAGVFPLQFETGGQVANQVGRLWVYDLPEDEYDLYRDRIRAVTTDAARAAGRAHVHPERAQVVVVGDADAIRADLEALGHGPVEVVEPG
ncbi:MAG: pitrilysin family protein [Gemmatimonadota bacterium]